jgi:hypothetical protein
MGENIEERIFVTLSDATAATGSDQPLSPPKLSPDPVHIT